MPLALLASSFLILHPLTAPVTIERRACSVAQILPELSQKTGLELSASADIGRQICLLWVHGAEGGDVLARFAAAMDGKWQKDGTKWKLVQDVDRLNEEKAAQRESRKKLFREIMAPISKQFHESFGQAEANNLLQQTKLAKDSVKANQGDPNARAAFDRLQLQSPYGRLVVRLLETLTPEQVAEIEPNQRVVFKLNPTKRQMGFGPGAAEALHQFVKEQEIWAATLEANPIERDNVTETVSDPSVQRDSFRGDPKNLRLVFSNWRSDGISCNLVDITEYGIRVLTQFSRRGPSSAAAWQMATQGDQSKSEPIKLSPDSALMLETFANRFSEKPKQVPIAPHALEMLLNPVKFEPMSWLATDGFVQLAEKKKANQVIGWVPDTIFGATSLRAVKPLTIDGFETVTTGLADGIDLDVAEGWMTVVPKDPIGTRHDFDDREAIAAVTSSVYKNHGLRLLEYAKYAAAVDHGAYTGFGIGYIFLLDPAAGSVSDGTDWDVLRLYGSLNDTQRLSLQQGNSIPFQSLNQRQRAIVDQLSYRREINNAAYEASNSYRQEYSAQDPTDALVNGVPINGFLSMKSDKKELLFGFGKNSEGILVPVRSINEETIGWYEYKKARGESIGYGQLDMVAYQLGDQNLHRLRLNYSDTLWNEYRMIENNPPSKAPVPWQQLPEERRSAIEAAIKRQEEEAKKSNSGGSPPPPRLR